MTAGQRFQIILVTIAAGFTVFGWFVRRLVHKADDAGIAREMLRDELAKARIDAVERHHQRNLDAITGISKVVADNNTRLTMLWEDVAQRLSKIEGMFGEWLRQ